MNLHYIEMLLSELSTENHSIEYSVEATEILPKVNKLAKSVDLLECPIEALVDLFNNRPIVVVNPIDGNLQVINEPMNYYNASRKAFDFRCELFESTYKNHSWVTGGVIIYLKHFGVTWWEYPEENKEEEI